MEAADLRNAVPPARVGPFFGFVGATVVLAVGLTLVPLVSLPGDLATLPGAFWIMAALAVVCDARPFVPPGQRHSSAVFPSICFTFAILIAWGPGAAVAVQTAAVVVSGWRLRHVAWRTTFNAAQYACALAAADEVIRLGPGSAFADDRLHWTDAVALAGAAVAWFVVSYGLVSMAVRLRFGDPWWPTVRRGLGFELLSTGSLLLLAPVLVAAARASAALIPLVLVPLFAVYRMARLSADQEHLAALDPLTGLPNRKALLTEVAEQIRRHAERGAQGMPDGQLALLLIDLDRFKNVNDALGHAVGDRLLVAVSDRLTSALGSRDMVARLGGDEFAVVSGGLTGVDDARRVADRVVRALAEPVPLDGLPLDVGGSIGIALFPEHGEDFATLMRHADVAMYDAKHRNDTIAVYAAESDHNSAERLGLLADLRRVLESGTTDPVAFDPAAAGTETAAGTTAAAGPGTATATGAATAATARGGDGAALPAGDDDTPVRQRSRRWGGRRDRPATHPDELINQIITGADPVRRRAGRTDDTPAPAHPSRLWRRNGRRWSGPGRPAAPTSGSRWASRTGSRCTTSPRSGSPPVRWSGWRRCCAGGTPSGHGRPGGADPGRRAERGDAAADPPGGRRRGGAVGPLVGGGQHPAGRAQRQRPGPAHGGDRRPDR